MNSSTTTSAALSRSAARAAVVVANACCTDRSFSVSVNNTSTTTSTTSSSSSLSAPSTVRWTRTQSSRLAPLLALLPLLALALLAPGAAALKATVHPGATECFDEHVSAEHFTVQGARIEGAFFVATRDAQHTPAMQVHVYAPSGEVLWSQPHVDADAHFNVAAPAPGIYRVCFVSASRVDVAVDLVYFHLGHMRRPAQVNVPKGTHETRGKELAKKDHLEEVKQSVLVVGELVDIVSGEQRYLHRKLERHIKTCHSNNRRTLWYTVLEVATLAAIGAFNVHFVSGLFKGAAGYGRIVV